MTIAALRFNNPGNVSLPIRGYNGPGQIVGISGQSGYASFPTMQDGLNAQQARLTSYINNGVNGSGPLTTISQLNTRYAEDPNWQNNVSRFSGIGVNTPLDPNNSQQMAALQGGIIRQETGRDPSVFGFNPSTASSFSGAPQNSNDPLQYTGPSGFSTAGVPGSVETSAGSQIVGFQQNADGSANVELGFANDGVGTNASGITASSFSQMDPSGTGVGGASGGASGAFGLGGIQAGGQTVGLDNAGTGGTSSADSPSSSAGGSMTVPQAIDTQTRGAATDTASLNKQSKSNTDSLNKTSQANTKSVTDTANSIFKAISGDWSDYFVRIVFVIVGLIALAAALMMFRPVQQAVVAVASKVPA